METRGWQQDSPARTVRTPPMAGDGRSTRSERDLERQMERERRGRQGANAEACRDLWVGVLRQAVEDLQWLQEHGFSWEQADSQKHQELLLYNPVIFLRSERFDDICRYIDLQPERVRELLDVDEMLRRSAAA